MKLKTKPKVRIKTELNHDSGVAYFTLYKKNPYRETEIGKLEVDIGREHKFLVISSHIDQVYRNNGFGKKLYEKALKKLGKLKTHFFEASTEAQRVWVSLSKKYKHRKSFFEGTLILRNKLNN